MNKFISFRRAAKSKSGKTNTWLVKTDDGTVLGRIKWFGRWRCYAFHPDDTTLYEHECLRMIADFCETQTKRLRKSWKR